MVPPIAFCVQIYLTAGKMFNLEDRVQELHSRVDGGGSKSSAHSLSDLEDQVAKTAAQVARSEKEVRLSFSLFYNACPIVMVKWKCIDFRTKRFDC